VKFKEPGQDANGVRLTRANDANGLFFASVYDARFQLPPSTKLTAALAVILTWLEEHGDEKIISEPPYNPQASSKFHELTIYTCSLYAVGNDRKDSRRHA
jgi:hypothetical protein